MSGLPLRLTPLEKVSRFWRLETRSQCCLRPQVGPQTLLGWFRHYFSLMAYALLARIGPVLKLVPKLGQSFWLARMLEAWTYGAGLDWGKHKGAAQHAEHGPDGAMPSLQGA